MYPTTGSERALFFKRSKQIVFTSLIGVASTPFSLMVNMNNVACLQF